VTDPEIVMALSMVNLSTFVVAAVAAVAAVDDDVSIAAATAAVIPQPIMIMGEFRFRGVDGGTVLVPIRVVVNVVAVVVCEVADVIVVERGRNRRWVGAVTTLTKIRCFSPSRSSMDVVLVARVIIFVVILVTVDTLVLIAMEVTTVILTIQS
jgi:hypothetical protein